MNIYEAAGQEREGVGPTKRRKLLYWMGANQELHATLST